MGVTIQLEVAPPSLLPCARKHPHTRADTLCAMPAQVDASQQLQDETHFVAAAIVKFVKLLQAGRSP